MWKEFFYETDSDYDKKLWEISLNICFVFWAYMELYETFKRGFTYY